MAACRRRTCEPRLNLGLIKISLDSITKCQFSGTACPARTRNRPTGRKVKGKGTRVREQAIFKLDKFFTMT